MGLCLYALTGFLPKRWQKIAKWFIIVSLILITLYIVLYIIIVKNIQFNIIDIKEYQDIVYLYLNITNNFMFYVSIDDLIFLDSDGNEYENLSSDILPLKLYGCTDKNISLAFYNGDYKQISIKIFTLLNSITFKVDVNK